MFRALFALFYLLATVPSYAQDAKAVVLKVLATQDRIATLSYSVVRNDTLVTGHTRTLKGQAKLTRLSTDTLMGLKYWGKRDDMQQETIYDGKNAFNIDHKERKYEMTSSAQMIPHYLGTPGGQMVLKDFLQLDTTGATAFNMKEDAQHYIITISLNDLKAYDVTNRFRRYYIDRKSHLPIQVILHQETLGKVQDLNYSIRDIAINDPLTVYDFSSERYPADYASAAKKNGGKVHTLLNRPMPFFELASFDNKVVTSANIANKVVLFDFWEVWCGPCLVSMPTVDSLFQKYRAKGLEVYGMMSEKDQLDAAKLLVNKRKYTFPMLLANENIKKLLGIIGVPTYVLVNKQGTITYISEGFSEALESEIRKALN